MKIFISHSHTAQDKGLVEELARYLRRGGFDVWTDAEIFPGDNWAQKIGEALKESSAMIVLVSPEWAQSRGAREEVGYAIGDPNYAGRVVPVFVRPTEDIPWVLRKFPAVDGTQDVETVSRQILNCIQQPVG
jgi:hypothetical protein